MRVSSFAPHPPARTGVADYAYTLEQKLRKLAGDTGPDVALYHLGNNELHRGIYQRSLTHPGVVVLHDAVLTHFLLGLLDEKTWTNEFVYNYGEWRRGFAGKLWRDRARSSADPRYFEYPMLKRIAEAARVIIVHNPAAARSVLRHAPRACVVEIPHFFEPPQIRPILQRTGPLRAGVFGYFRESKRLPAIQRAVSAASSRGAEWELVLAGSFASTDLERAMAPLTCTGHLSREEFFKQAQSVDVCINLRYPSAHETSGVGVQLMGLGKPVIFTAGEELARLPEDTHLRVEHGPLEEETLTEYLIWLAENPEARSEIGRRAAAYIAREHNLQRVAGMFWDVLTTQDC